MVSARLWSIIFGIVAIGLLVFVIHAIGSDSLDFDGLQESRGSSRAATYVGSETCGQTGCHVSAYNSWNATVHGRILVNRTEAEAAGLPLPEGEIWDNITYVVGHKWKVLYLNETGYFITSDQNGPGGNQWDVRDQEWTDYHAGEQLLQYTCGNCHTTGYNVSDSITGMAGIVGNWSEEGVGCEACHGPGSDHASSPSPDNIGKDPTAEACGKCHQNPYSGKATVVNPGRTNHGQYNDWYNSKHQEANVDCVSCHDPHDTSDALYGTYTNYTEVKPAKVKYLLGGSYVSVSDSQELCGKCHSTLESDLGHGNGTVNATCVDCHMALSRTTVNEWDIRSHTFKVNDGVDYGPSADPNTKNFPYFTCEQSPCHTGGIPHFTEWNSSAHANSYHAGETDNTYCAHCMAPFQGDPSATYSSNEPVSKENWTGINCAVCHDIHSDPSSLSLYNGTSGQREAPVTNPADICRGCHNNEKHPQYLKWAKSGHANSYNAGAGNTYCAKCMSPFQHDPLATSSSNSPVAESDWWGVNCVVCHKPHSLELALYNGTDYSDPIDHTAELCAGCHVAYNQWKASPHAHTYHSGETDNTYCAHCMSPFQYEEYYNETIKTNETYKKPISFDDWEGVTCIACHDQHSLELALYNGTGREPPVKDPSKLCSGCHADKYHPQYSKWVTSAHADTYQAGVNDNTYCAKCMSPLQTDPLATLESNDQVKESEWFSIICTVCHNPHSQELQFYNGTGYSDPVKNPADLCKNCHSGNYQQYDEWADSAHANSYSVAAGNTYCAKCMSPLQHKPLATESVNDPVSEENWTGINCIICHEQHTLELALFNGTIRGKTVSNPAELCGGCHDNYPAWKKSPHANTYSSATGNTYCAKCMSPFQHDPLATSSSNEPVSAKNWTGVNCIVCHNKHSLESQLYDGTGYGPTIDNSSDLCGGCHDQYEEWEGSSHASTYKGYNNNTYCAHCMSPYQGDPDATDEDNEPVEGSDWQSIGCNVCHDEHSLELAFFNGAEREEPVENPAELCGTCHQGTRHPQYPDWKKSTHATTAPTTATQDRNNTFCARCHSPFQADPEATATENEPIDLADWDGIICTSCHTPHSLELKFYNGSGYEDVNEDPNELCGKCHSGTAEFEGAPFVIDIYTQWKESAHYDTYKGSNDDTYCAHCMSPYQGDPLATENTDVEIGAGNWTSIGCIVCHDKHSLELMFYNGSAYEEVDDTIELCGACHRMSSEPELGHTPHHPQLEMRTGTGAFEVDDTRFMASVDCGDCHAVDSDHSFEFNVQGCVNCHNSYNLISGQAVVDKWQEETQELLNRTKVNLTLAKAAKASAESNGTWSARMNTSYYTALFNYEFVIADASTGAHNPEYAEKLLDDANDRFLEIIEDIGLLPPIKVTPADGSADVPVSTVVTVQFENAINFTDLQTNGYLTLSGGVTGTVTYDGTTYTVTFTPSAALGYETTYTATLGKAVKYEDGSPILNKDFSWSFTTEKEPAKDITIIIGTILDEDGNPIVGATVTIVVDNQKFSGKTNESGYAAITVPADRFTPGTYEVEVTKDGYDDLTFDVTIDDDGDVTPPSGGYPKMKEAEDVSDNTLIYIIIIIVVIIVVLMVLMLMMRKKAEIPGEEVAAEEEEAAAGEFECPACGAVVGADEKVCPECGEEFEEEVFKCPECGTELDADAGNCEACGATFEPGEDEGEELEDEGLGEDDDYEVEEEEGEEGEEDLEGEEGEELEEGEENELDEEGEIEEVEAEEIEGLEEVSEEGTEEEKPAE